MEKNPITYEINTRSWIRQFGKKATLGSVPEAYWKQLSEKGVDFVWLMGIWQTSPTSIKTYCFHPDLVKAYDRISKDWTPEDIYGSPYAIEDYFVDDHLGSLHDMLILRDKLHKHGMGLILDFVPNHFNAHSKLISQHPNIFMEVSENQAKMDVHTYYQAGDKYFAHGKDPYFPAWTDTVQINYFSGEAHHFMMQKLMMVAGLCDGVRCDMAMLVLPEIFSRTWHQHIPEVKHEDNFWIEAISQVKSKYPDFLFIAEAYWDTQRQLQQLGFDYTYDKHLLDLLKRGSLKDIVAHLDTDIAYQRKCVRFIENHDEDRSLKELGESKSRAASVVMSTIPGMKLFYDGQWEGRRLRPPVQMGTDFGENICVCSLFNTLEKHLKREIYCACQAVHYDSLLACVGDELLKSSEWRRLKVEPDYSSVLAWECYGSDHRILIAVNYNLNDQTAYIEIPEVGEAQFCDLLNKAQYSQVTMTEGKLSLFLPGYKSILLQITDRN